MVRLSSTVITPSLPTFFMASAMMPPICLSLLALIVPTCAIMSPFTSRCSFWISSMEASTARSMPRLSPVGLAPAATVLTPSRKMACANTVAVVVPSPATSEVLEATSRTICAPMFSRGSRNSISLATVTPSLVMIGAPNFFSITALRPLGPRVIFTASARALTPRRMDWREFSPVTICFAMSLSPLQKISDFKFEISELRPCALASRHGEDLCGSLEALALKEKLLSAAGCFGCAGEFCQDFVFAEDEVILVFHLDFGAAVLAEQDAVTRFYVESDTLALVVNFACACGDHFALLRLFFRRVGDDDAALDGLFLFDPLDQDTIVERSYIY